MSYPACFRTSQKRYIERPRHLSSAQVAWDLLSASGPPLKDLKLMDGDWFCEREDGMLDTVDAAYALALFRDPQKLRVTLQHGRMSSQGMRT
jgi:hypothetical protein